MPKADMSAEAVTTRLKRVSQLRRLGLSLQKAKIRQVERKADTNEHRHLRPKSNKRKAE